MDKKSYRDLEIFQLAYKLAIDVHTLSLSLPSNVLYEQGSQVRRSDKSVKDNIVEGYGRKRYKDDFIKFLVYSQASCCETIEHLRMISEIYHQQQPLAGLIRDYEFPGKKISSFIQYVETNRIVKSGSPQLKPPTKPTNINNQQPATK